MDNGVVRRWLALGAAALAASGALTLVAPAEAQAATAGSCAGREVWTMPFATGIVHVYRQGGYVCAITLAGGSDAQRPMSVSVQARGNRPVVDKGQFRHRAGPVTVHAGHRCVWVKGSVGRSSVSSGWILC